MFSLFTNPIDTNGYVLLLDVLKFLPYFITLTLILPSNIVN